MHDGLRSQIARRAVLVGDVQRERQSPALVTTIEMISRNEFYSNRRRDILV
jgi:hypothetical protein